MSLNWGKRWTVTPRTRLAWTVCFLVSAGGTRASARRPSAWT